MAASKDQKEGKKLAEKKVKEKTIKRGSNPTQKRGQPTAAARLISSPYIKFGWHKPLSGTIKDKIQAISSIADSMYQLQLNRARPIDSLSLRNGIFWEHRQLQDDSIVSTPALDHIDLFPIEEGSFQDTIKKIGKQPSDDGGFRLHYLFENIRSREFLLLPIEVSGSWITIITRSIPIPRLGSGIDREVTDLAIVDPQPQFRKSRRDFVTQRLRSILLEGCVRLSEETTIRDITVPNVDGGPSPPRFYPWQSGLIAYAVSREFLRRLRILQYRRLSAHGSSDEDFLWAPFEEHHNFDAYRQSLMAACANQTIETSGFAVRLALEVPSDDSNYEPNLLQSEDATGPERDEKWEIFQSQTHTLTVPSHAGSETRPNSASSVHSPVAPELFTTPNYDVPGPAGAPTSPKFGPDPPSPTSCSPFGTDSPVVMANETCCSSLEEPGCSRCSPQYGPTTPPPTGRNRTANAQLGDGSHHEEAPVWSIELKSPFPEDLYPGPLPVPCRSRSGPITTAAQDGPTQLSAEVILCDSQSMGIDSTQTASNKRRRVSGDDDELPPAKRLGIDLS